MTFLNPIFFWAFLSLIPLTLIYLLKVRPRRKPTTAYFLWEDIFQERRPNKLLQRLRDFWSLLLMMLAFAAICLALTNPQVADDERKDVLLLIDHSLSMNTQHGGRTRLEMAKDTAADILRAFDGVQRAAVAAVAHEVRYLSHVTDNPRELLDAVEKIEATSYSMRPAELAASVAGQDWLQQQRVLLITDGCFDTSKLPPRIELLMVGRPVENAGLVAADIRRIPGGPNRLGLYFQLASTFKETQNIDLLVSHGDTEPRLFKVVPVEVPPGIQEPQVYTLENAESGAWTLSLDIQDALSIDNVAYLTVPRKKPIRVQVDSDDRFFLENSVLAFSEESGLLELASNEADIVMSKSTTPDASRSVIFQPEGESPWWTSVGELLDLVAPRVAIEDHPVLHHLDASTISFAGARQLTVPPQAQVLVASDQGVPLIYRMSNGEKTAIVVNMDPITAEFYFSAWFPVLVHSAATHLVGREASPRASYRPGDLAGIPGVQAGEQTEVTTPSGQQVETSDKELGPLEETGIYRLHNKGGDWLVASSPLSLADTSVNNEHVKDTSQPISQGWPLAHLLTIAAVIVVGTESVLYHRRKVG